MRRWSCRELGGEGSGEGKRKSNHQEPLWRRVQSNHFDLTLVLRLMNLTWQKQLVSFTDHTSVNFEQIQLIVYSWRYLVVFLHVMGSKF